MKQHGFTLIETLVVTSIIGILAMIAVPSYRAFVEQAETTSDTVEGTGERIALAIESLEGPLPSASAASVPSTPAASSTPQNNEPSAPPAASTPASNSEPSSPPSTSTASASAPPTSNTTNGAAPQESAPSEASSSEAASNNTEPPATGSAGTTGGGSGGSNNNSTQASIQVQDKYKECSSESGNCKVKAGDDFEVSFNLQSLGKISEKDIKLITTGGANVDDFSYNSKKGTLEIEMEAPDKKDKTFSLTVNAGKEKSTLYFKTS